MEWGITYPHRVGSLVLIATAAQASAQQIALQSVGRQTIRLDPNWRGGDYYDAEPGQGPHAGLALARELAQVMFRTDDVFTHRFGREFADREAGFGLWQRFQVERYLDYHGDKLVKRFDANSYVLISKAMDLHDVKRGRGNLEAALSRLKMPVRAIGIWSDVMYPTYQQREIVETLQSVGLPADYVEIDSAQGHDAFLIDTDQVNAAIGPFLDQVAKL
jgi:homoserine O-acetyltransferase